MPQSKSALKRMRQNEVQRLLNRSAKGVLKSQIKRVLSAVEAGDRETAEREFRATTKLLDRAGLKRYIHPNAASRKKSSLARKINEMGA